MRQRGPLRFALFFLVSATLLSLQACSEPPRRKSVFQFAGGGDLSPTEVYETDPPLSEEEASYKVTSRQYLLYAPDYSYQVNNVQGYDGIFGNYAFTSESYAEAGPVGVSPYFIVKSNEEKLSDPRELLEFMVVPSYQTVASTGGVVWAQVHVRAPASVPPRTKPMNVALVLDLSSAMRETGGTQLAVEAARAILASLLPTDTVALVTYSDDAEVAVENTEPGDPRLWEALARIESGATMTARSRRSTAMGEGRQVGAALVAAYEELDRARGGAKAPGHVVLISDGDLGPTWRLEALARDRKAFDARLNAVGVGERIEPEPLHALATAGDGQLILAEDAGALRIELESALRRIVTAYARRVRLNISSSHARVIGVYGRGVPHGAPLQELSLPDLASGEEQRLLVELAASPLASGTAPVVFRLTFQQDEPVRRTTLEETLYLESSETPGETSGIVLNHARVARAFEWLRAAINASDELQADRVLEFAATELPAIHGLARAQGDRDLEARARTLEDLARRFGDLRRQQVPRTDRAWRELRLDLFRALD